MNTYKVNYPKNATGAIEADSFEEAQAKLANKRYWRRPEIIGIGLIPEDPEGDRRKAIALYRQIKGMGAVNID